MLDTNSKLFFSAFVEVLRFLEKNSVPCRTVCQGSYSARTKRQILTSLSILDDKYYIYYQGRYINNPSGSGKISVFSSIVLIDWSTGDPIELEHQHVESLEDINSFIKSLDKYIKEEC